MGPECAKEEIEELKKKGEAVELVERNGQWYALARGLPASSPPWNKTSFDVLIAIPAAYDAAQLDGFYVELPCTYNGADPARVQGDPIDVADRNWRQVSWHYPDGKPWQRGRDSLATHIVHCRGFFLGRGAVNER